MNPRSRKARSVASDPLSRPCPTCGARKGRRCRITGNDARPIAKASAVVHADRLEAANA